MRTFAIAPSAGRGPRRRIRILLLQFCSMCKLQTQEPQFHPFFVFCLGVNLATHTARGGSLSALARGTPPHTHTNGSTCREPARDCDGHAAIFSEARLHPGFCERQGPAASGISRAFALQLLCIDLRASSKVF